MLKTPYFQRRPLSQLPSARKRAPPALEIGIRRQSSLSLNLTFQKLERHIIGIREFDMESMCIPPHQLLTSVSSSLRKMTTTSMSCSRSTWSTVIATEAAHCFSGAGLLPSPSPWPASSGPSMYGRLGLRASPFLLPVFGLHHLDFTGPRNAAVACNTAAVPP